MLVYVYDLHHDTHTEAVSQSGYAFPHSLSSTHIDQPASSLKLITSKQGRQAVRSEASLAPLLSHQARQAGSDITAILILIRSLDVVEEEGESD